MDVAVGCSVGTGWAVLVTLRSDGAGSEPVVVDRRRVDLTQPEERFLYHVAMGLDIAAAEPFVAGVAKRADDAASEAVGELRSTLGLQPRAPLRAVVVGPEPPWDWPPLVDIVRSHTMVHTAEGHFYREVIWDALQGGGGDLSSISRKGLTETVAVSIDIDPRVLQRHVTELGKPLGSPWRREQKEAATAAWWALAR